MLCSVDDDDESYLHLLLYIEWGLISVAEAGRQDACIHKSGKKDIYGLIVVTSKLLYGSNMLLPTLLYRSILGSRCVPIFSQLQNKASLRMLDSKIRGVQKCEALHANRVFSLFEAYFIRKMHIDMLLNIRPNL